MTAKIVFYADGHLDARGPAGAGGFNAEQRLHQNSVEAFKSLRSAVDLANERQADLFVVTGDMFDTGRPMPEIVARVMEELARLDSTKVVMVEGNHDQQGVLAGHRTPIMSYFNEQPWCAGAFGEAGVFEYNGLALANVPWMRVSSSNVLGATNEALEAQVEALAAGIPEGRPALLGGHMVLAECSFDSGKRGSELSMVTSTLEASVPTALIDAGPWAAARLGHIHKRQQLSDKTGYTGSPYKVSFGEANDPKGVDLVTLEDDNTATVEFCAFDVRQLVKIDLTTAEKPATFSPREGDVVRLVTDSERLERAEDLARTFEAAGANVHVHRVADQIVAIAREAQYDTDMGPVEALNAYMEKKEIPTSKRSAILAAFSDVTDACQH